jgi:hypothetical protein
MEVRMYGLFAQPTFDLGIYSRDLPVYCGHRPRKTTIHWQGDPPAEPASSQQGVKPVRFTQRVNDNSQTPSVDGPNLPVEVWQEEDNPDGLDCTSTDGPGAKLFARGLMTWTVHSVTTPTATASDISLKSRVVGVDGRPYSYLVRYLTGQQ